MPDKRKNLNNQTINKNMKDDSSSNQTTKSWDVKWWVEIMIAIIGLTSIQEITIMMDIVLIKTWLMIPIVGVLSVVSYILANGVKDISVKFMGYLKTNVYKNNNINVPIKMFNTIAVIVFFGIQLSLYDFLIKYCIKSKEALLLINIQQPRILISSVLLFVITAYFSIVTFIFLLAKLYKDLCWGQCLVKYRFIGYMAGPLALLMGIFVIYGYIWL